MDATLTFPEGEAYLHKTSIFSLLLNVLNENVSYLSVVYQFINRLAK